MTNATALLPLPGLLGFSPEEMTELVTSLGQPGFRSKQLVEWIFEKRADSFEAMTNLPKPLREATRATLTKRLI